MNTVSQKIIESKKYKAVYPEVVERIVLGLEKKYKKQKDVEENTRGLLHQIWGAYYTIRPDFKKLIRNFQESTDKKEYILNTLRVHSSTNERIGDYKLFLDWMYEKLKVNVSFYDAGCGLNPLFFVLDERFHSKEMIFADIDIEEVEFLNVVFKEFGLSNFKAEVKDIFTDYPKADVVMMLKLLPVIEQQERGASVGIINKMEFKNLIISYPTKSIGGREKGMSQFYSDLFTDVISKTGLRVIDRLDTPVEMYFMCEK